MQSLLIVLASLIAEHTASVVTKHRLSSCSSQAVEYGLSCSAACQIFPDQGSNSYLLHWQVGFFPTVPPGKSYLLFLDRAFYKCQLDSKQLMMFIPSASLLIFCLLVLSTTKEIVKSPTITVDSSILLFISVSFTSHILKLCC